MALSAFAEPAPAVIQRPVTHLFAKPTTEASVVSQAIFGWNVQILEEDQSFLKVRTPDDYTGWVETSAVVKRDMYVVSGTVASVRMLFGSVYRETSITRQQPLLVLPFESRLEVLEQPDAEEYRWIKVRLPDSHEAWIQRGDVTLRADTLSREEMLTFSRRFLGLPYLWGGASTYGYDCSGFVQMLLRQTGVSMPRDAQPQAEWQGVEPVQAEELQPGDLLYFGPSENKITHTGMYLGGGRFIHATAHEIPAVQISSLDDPHWTKVFLSSRRVK